MMHLPRTIRDHAPTRSSAAAGQSSLQRMVRNFSARTIATIGCFMLATAVSTPATAQTFGRSGVITQVFLSSPTNYSFRVHITSNGVNQLSDCTANFAFFSTNNPNYDAYVAALLTSYSLQRPVSLTITKQSDGFCRIEEFASYQ